MIERKERLEMKTTTQLTIVSIKTPTIVSEHIVIRCSRTMKTKLPTETLTEISKIPTLQGGQQQ